MATYTKRKYSQEEIQAAVEKSTNFSDVFRNLGLIINGGSYYWIKKLVKQFEIDTSHFLSKKEQMILAGKKANLNVSKRAYSSGDISNGERKSARPLRAFLLFNKVEECCTECSLTEWRGSKIRLDIDHLDGDCTNNKLENLQFLCPNCHRQKTIKYVPTPIRVAKEKIKRALKIPCRCSCGELKKKESKRCMKCFRTSKLKIEWPSDQILQEYLWEKSRVEISTMLGVSDNAIKKFALRRGLIVPNSKYIRNLQLGNLSKCGQIREELEKMVLRARDDLATSGL